jgi:hypothetical protein
VSLHQPGLRTGRRAFVGGGLAWLIAAMPAAAQRAPDAGKGKGDDAPAPAPAPAGADKLDADGLERLIAKALAEPDETPLSRPAILGLGDKKLTTKSIEHQEPGEKYGFMVVIPRRDTGLIFFRGVEKPSFYAVHLTGAHLQRVSSAINRNGKLEKWTGKDADADFTKQTTYWAKLA